MKQPLSDSSCSASASHGNHHLGSYEPTSVLDPIATSSGSPATTTGAPARGGTPQHVQATPHHPPGDWDALSWLLSPDQKDGAGELFSLNAQAQHSSLFDVLADPFDPYCSPAADSYEQHLRAAAEAVWSADSVAADGMLARLTQAIPHPPRTSPQRAASHFAEALRSLLAAPDQFLAQAERPAVSAADVIRRIGAQRAFACLSPIPQFASFTANQTLLEAFEAAAAPFHIIDFDLGLGGQWSSFVEEVAARRLPSQHATPAVRVTAVVHEETAETLLAADNLRDFACGLGVRFSVDIVRLGALAIGSIRASCDEAVAVVLSPAIFRHLAATRPDASDALMEFIRRTDPKVVVLVDAEVALGAGEGVEPLMRSVESCTVLTESVEAAAAAVGAGDGEDALRRVDRGFVRDRAYAAVRSWWSRCEPWKETVVRARWAPAALSDLATAQAEWIVRRAPVEGYHVVRRDGALVLCWHGYDLAVTSAWTC